MRVTKYLLVFGLAAFLIHALMPWSWAQEAGNALPQVGPAAAESPLTDYAARAVLQVMLNIFLVAILLGGAFMVLNLGLLSKRRSDFTGHRDPSDVGVLKGQIWPNESVDQLTLPAEDSEDEPADYDRDDGIGGEVLGPKFVTKMGYDEVEQKVEEGRKRKGRRIA